VAFFVSWFLCNFWKPDSRV